MFVLHGQYFLDSQQVWVKCANRIGPQILAVSPVVIPIGCFAVANVETHDPQENIVHGIKV